MDNNTMQALGQAYYGKANMDVIAKGDMTRMIQEVGQKPALWVVTMLCLAITALSMWLIMRSRSDKRMGIIFGLYVVVVGAVVTHADGELEKSRAMPRNDLYALRFTGEQEPATVMLTDGLYEIASIKENKTAYRITTLTDSDENPITVSLPKDSYRLEPAVKVSSDSVEDLQDAVKKAQTNQGL